MTDAAARTTLRPVHPAEHEAVGAVVLAAYDAVGRMSDEYRRQLRDTAARIDGESTVLVAVDDDRVVGTITAADGGVRALAVDPRAQGRGIGRALVERVIADARAAGWRRVALTTMAFMHGAQRLYEDLGFERRPDLDVRYPAGVGRVYALDLVPDAASAFPAPGPVPDDPPWYEDVRADAPGC